MFPGDPSGGAAEVVNCHCALLQRARWALDEDELKALQERAEYFGLDKSDSFEEYKKKYLKAAETIKNSENTLTNSEKSDKIPLGKAEIDDIYDLSKYNYISDSELNEWKKSCGVSTTEEYKQINKHTKADGSNGGYVRSHRAWQFNAELREGKEDLLDDDDKKTLSTIRNLCKKNSTDRPVILDRFVDSDYLSE